MKCILGHEKVITKLMTNPFVNGLRLVLHICIHSILSSYASRRIKKKEEEREKNKTEILKFDFLNLVKG